jgi:trimeric autotransporter adhesin
MYLLDEIYIRSSVWRSRKTAGVLGLFLLTLLAASLLFAKPAHADTFNVTNTNDTGAGSLRRAIERANANRGADAIRFNIPGSGVKTISPTSELPSITGPVTINGYTQPGSRPNSRKTGANDAIMLVEISGTDSTLEIDASNVVVRGLVINRASGSGISIESGAGSRIEGNFLGTDPSGTLDRGNSSFGVQIDGGGNHTVGGTSPAARNLISGNNSFAVEISDNSVGGNKVQGNLMGVQSDGTSFLGGARAGMYIDAPNNTIGGTKPSLANTIANNFGEGIIVDLAGTRPDTGNRISGNSIFGNGLLGIDLDEDGRTENDPRDHDSGANKQQNFPVLTSAEVAGSTTTIRGTLDSVPSTKRKEQTFIIQFFSNPSLEDEGKTFLGQKKVTTNRQGEASFSFEMDRALGLSESTVTATATDARGNTSEFSDPETLSRL